jgi:hypothetical protein
MGYLYPGRLNILEVRFYEIGEIDDSLLKYAVIVSRYRGKWVFYKTKGVHGNSLSIIPKSSLSLQYQAPCV